VKIFPTQPVGIDRPVGDPSGGPQWGTRTQPATDGRKVVGSTAWGGEVPQSDLDLVPWTATGGVKCGENMKKMMGISYI